MKYKALGQQQRRIGLAAFGVISGMIELFKQLVDRVPVDDLIELFGHGQGADGGLAFHCLDGMVKIAAGEGGVAVALL